LKKKQATKDIFQDVHEIHTHNQVNTQDEHADQHTSETSWNMLADMTVTAFITPANYVYISGV
jgi:hypothetical protein